MLPSDTFRTEVNGRGTPPARAPCLDPARPAANRRRAMTTTDALSAARAESEHLKHECSRLHSEITHLQVSEERLKADVLRLEAENDGLRAENASLKCQRQSMLAILQGSGPTN
jgi:chromosome segregation ATPase